MTRFKSAFAVPSGFAVATRTTAAQVGTTQDTRTNGSTMAGAVKRRRQTVSLPTASDRAA